MAHVAESTHWYRRDGSPCYTVTSKDGTERPTNLRDARKLDLVPSVTSVIKCAAAPGLEAWKQTQVLLAALTLPRNQGEPEAQWLARVMLDSRETARKAADRGTQIHAALQGYYSGEHPDQDFWKHIAGATEAIGRWKETRWVPEQPFASPLGFGGKVDLFSREGFVLDVKTKEFDVTLDLKTWDEHAMQLAAYREGLGLPQARCAICYVSSSTPGLAKLIEIPEEELQQGWTMFYSLLHYWQAKSKYKSSFERLAA